MEFGTPWWTLERYGWVGTPHHLGGGMVKRMRLVRGALGFWGDASPLPGCNGTRLADLRSSGFEGEALPRSLGLGKARFWPADSVSECCVCSPSNLTDSVKNRRTPSNSPDSVKFSGLRQILRTPSKSPDSVIFVGLRPISSESRDRPRGSGRPGRLSNAAARRDSDVKRENIGREGIVLP